MTGLRFILPAALGVGVVAASLVLSSAPQIHSQEVPPPNEGGRFPRDVRVGNTDPISTAVMNTVGVNIGVPPVTVGNPDFQKPRPALPVLDIREAARKPFAYWAPFDFEGRKDGRVLWTERQTAPQDQFVVLEYVHVLACSQPGEKISVNLYVTYDYGSGQKGQRAQRQPRWVGRESPSISPATPSPPFALSTNFRC